MMMSIFDLNSEPDSTPPPQPPTAVKQAEMRKMVGYENISDVAADAPSDYATPANRESKRERASGRSERSERASVRTQAAQKKDAEAAAKAERQQRALETIGKKYAKLLAELPYEFWARFADDPRLKLNPEQAKELADDYFLLAQSINPDLTSPWVIALGIVISNAILIVERLKYLGDEEKIQKLADETVKHFVQEDEDEDDRKR